MGDTKRTRKKYQTPSHPWEAGRIEEERQLVREYGLKNKKEIWLMRSIARTISSQAKGIIAKREDVQTQKQKELLLKRLLRYNFITEGEPIESALAISLKDVLERRLQTMVVRKRLARTMSQARQLITHKHIRVGDKVITSPAYLISASEESTLAYAENSAFSEETHPERPDFQEMKEIQEEKKAIESQKEEVVDGIEEQEAPGQA